MPFINHAKKEISIKVVYNGPGLSGKTTNLDALHKMLPNKEERQFITVDTANERTLFFDFLNPTDNFEGAYRIRYNLYTVPGQVVYKEARKIVLKGVDAVVLVFDSQIAAQKENIELLKELENYLQKQDIEIKDIATVVQYNKRDLKNIMDIKTMEADLNPFRVSCFEAIAIQGIGVKETFETVCRLAKEKLLNKKGPLTQAFPWLNR